MGAQAALLAQKASMRGQRGKRVVLRVLLGTTSPSTHGILTAAEEPRTSTAGLARLESTTTGATHTATRAREDDMAQASHRTAIALVSARLADIRFTVNIQTSTTSAPAPAQPEDIRRLVQVHARIVLLGSLLLKIARVVPAASLGSTPR